MPTECYDRTWFQGTLAKILAGWYRVLRQTSESCAVWEPPGGIHTKNFVSRSGLQCDGVTRMMPALAAWAAQADNPETIELDEQDGGEALDPKEVLRMAFIHATDPDHPDFWEYAPTDHAQQRQVESSVVAWSLWLSRDWLLPRLSEEQTQNIQKWLASCTVFTDHFNNWSLFTAVNHAARAALSAHGFSGDLEAVRRDLIPGDEVNLADGWMWDGKYHGIDYYNFWVWGSHHAYLRAMLPEYENAMLDRALERHDLRLADLPFLIDAQGRNVLFGRSLSYRWGWLTGLVAAHYIGRNPVDPGLSRAMLARNLQAWLDADSLNEHGVIRERLSPHGSDGGRSGYINCGHPYWGMQAFLCLALPDSHAFWTSPPQPLPIDEGAFLEKRQGPGFVFQGIAESGEVRLFNLRNLNHSGNALYEKFVYSSEFPCNADTTSAITLWDNQFGLRMGDGSHRGPEKVLEVDVLADGPLRLIWQFRLGDSCTATVFTEIRIDGERYETTHEIRLDGPPPRDTTWIEGGFALGLRKDEEFGHIRSGDLAWVRSRADKRAVVTENLRGWDSIHEFTGWRDLASGVKGKHVPNIIYPRACHTLLTCPVKRGRTMLRARHAASVDADRILPRSI